MVKLTEGNVTLFRLFVLLMAFEPFAPFVAFVLFAPSVLFAAAVEVLLLVTAKAFQTLLSQGNVITYHLD
jgi:hypothetical protein